MWHKLKCMKCGRIFTGDTREEAQKIFDGYHRGLGEATLRKGEPLWLTDEEGKDLMFGDQTADERAKALKEYQTKNLNE